MDNNNRIENTFAQGKAFVGYLTAGDGGMEKTLQNALALIEGGVNILELGVPFSDPIADGPVIQRAASRALENGTTIQDILNLAKEIRKKSDIPLILFSYYNPILANMSDTFFKSIQTVGIDGILVVDCPLEEAGPLHEQCIKHNLAPIYVITPATSIERIKLINKQASGFLYYACRKGTTGVKNDLPADFVDKIKTIKNNTQLPVVVGFGISNREMAANILKYADGFVVGSRFVDAFEKGISQEKLSAIAKEINPLE